MLVCGRTVVGAAVLFGFGGMTLGCFPPPPVEEPDPCNVQIVTLNLYAKDDINPNENERPRPVVVRLYQLANDLKMLNAKYDPILLNDVETLGEDLLKVDELEVFPNDLVQIKFERIPEATTLVGVALFRDPQGQSWKTYYNFPPMPNAPEACGADAGDEDPEAPQAFPTTEFFVVERKIDNGSQFDASMFPESTPIKKISLPKRSASPSTEAAAK